MSLFTRVAVTASLCVSYFAASACGSSDSGGKGSFTQKDGGGDAAVSADTSTGSGGNSQGSGGAPGTGGKSGSGGANSSGGTASGDAASSGGSTGTPTSCAADGGCASGRCDPTSNECVECLFDNECGTGQRCSSGVCATPTTCTDSRDCRSNTDGRTICNTTTSACVQCNADADCGAGRVCAIDTCVDSGTCSPSDGGDAGAGCKAGQVCSPSGICVGCVNIGDCTGGQECFVDTCRTPCASDNDCLAGNQLCDLQIGACVDCTKDAECADLEYCSNGSCQPDVCAQGVKSCVGNSVVECNASGSGVLTPVACGQDEQCVKIGTTDAQCKPVLLADGGTPPPANCTDGTLNGDETDVDCGGSCPKCADGDLCSVATDCTSNVCEAACSGLLCFPGTRDKKCRPASCNDGTKNGAETDVDCGGSSCSRCVVGETCTQNSDCEADICSGGKCVAAQCTATQCPPCLFPTDKPCCITSSGLCGCASTFPFPGTCQ